MILIYAMYVSKDSFIEPQNYCRDFYKEESPKSIEANEKLGCFGRIVEYLVEKGYNSWTVQSIPVGFVLPILISIYECRLSPPLDLWSPKAFELIGRPELQTKFDHG